MVHDTQRRVGAKAIALRLCGNQRSFGRGHTRAKCDRYSRIGGERLFRHKGQPAALSGALGPTTCRLVCLELVAGGQPDRNGLIAGHYLYRAQHRLGIDPLVKGNEEQGLQGLRAG